MRSAPLFVVVGALQIGGCDAQQADDDGPYVSDNSGWYDGVGGQGAEGGQGGQGGAIEDAYVSDNSGWYDAEIPAVDGGRDAGVDGGLDGGAGSDGGADGNTDGGADGGEDVGTADGGADGGVEAPEAGTPDGAPEAPDGQACAPGRHGLDWTALAFCAPEGVPAGLRPYRGLTSPFLVHADLAVRA